MRVSQSEREREGYSAVINASRCLLLESGEVGKSRACSELKYEKQIESHFSPAETGKE